MRKQPLFFIISLAVLAIAFGLFVASFVTADEAAIVSQNLLIAGACVLLVGLGLAAVSIALRRRQDYKAR